MIRFEQGNYRFNYRVVGIAIHNGLVLLHQNISLTLILYYRPPLLSSRY